MKGASGYPNSMEHFGTSRLIAERLHEGHLADLIALHLDPDVSRYLGGVRSPETTKTYLRVNMAHWDRYGFGLWALRTQTGEFAGRAGIRQVVVDGAEEIEIAYTFKRTLWGQGLASEITNALTNIGLFGLNCRPLSAWFLSRMVRLAASWRNQILSLSGARSITAKKS